MLEIICFAHPKTADKVFLHHVAATIELTAKLPTTSIHSHHATIFRAILAYFRFVVLDFNCFDISVLFFAYPAFSSFWAFFSDRAYCAFVPLQ